MTTEKRKTQPKRARKTALQVIVKDGEPSAVIVDIAEYRELLERAEDAEDLRLLEKMRKRPLKYRKLSEFLAEHSPHV